MSWPLPPEFPDRSRLHRFGWGRLWVGDFGPTDSRLEPLVLLHGLFTTGYDWRRIADVARERRVLVPDLPGCGNSDRPPPVTCEDYSIAWLAKVIHEIVDSMKLRRVHVAGHDLGGTVAAHLCQRLGARVGSLVLVAPYCFPVDPLALVPRPLPGLRKALSLTGVGAGGVFRRLFRQSDLEDFLLRSLHSRDALEPQVVEVYWDRLTRDGGLEAAEAMIERVEALKTLPDAFRRIETPCRVVWGHEDRITPVSSGRRLVDRMHNATLLELEACGHAPQREQPQALIELLTQEFA